MDAHALLPLHITTLGHTSIRYGDELLSDSLLNKSQALLIYLAVNPQAHTREHLAGLLWSDMPQENALGNLRTALSRLRPHLADYLVARRGTLRFDPTPGCWLDVSACEGGLRRDDPRARREALELYRGEFLAGFSLRAAPLYEEWVLVERERLHQQAVTGLAALADDAWAAGDLAAAIQDFQRLLRLDPWRESVHRDLMQLWAENGDRAAALAQYEHCRRVLAEELGVPPAAETEQLYEQVRRGEFRRHRPAYHAPEPPDGRATRHNLPAPAASFHGRAPELEQIFQSLQDPGCRLLTLTGPGGCGKTRLAQEAARRLAASPAVVFPQGIWFVPLAGAVSRADIVAALAEALGFTFSGHQEPQAQLFAYLRTRQALLVLDNFEHLVEAAPLLADLLQAALQLKVLVTSRERLRLYEEWVLVLEGLPYPDAEETGGEDLPAVELFVQRARRASLGYDFAAEAPAVRAVCRLLEGLPLGIELAASWTHVFSTAEIAAAVADNLQALAVETRNLPARHLSLEATFDYSWGLLTADERRALANLAVCRGSFTRPAASTIALATDRTLANLVEKSLLQRLPGGRYRLHEQIRQFAWARLSPDGQRQAERRQREFYASFVASLEETFYRTDQDQALQDFTVEIDNLHQAWSSALAAADLPTLDQLLDLYYHYYMQAGLHRQGAQIFAAAAEALQSGDAAAPADPARQRLLGRVLIRQGRCAEFISGGFDRPRGLLESGLALARQHNLPADRALACLSLGLLALVRGEPDQAGPWFEQGQQLAREQGQLGTLARILSLSAWVHATRGEYQPARALCEQALELQEKLHDSIGLASSLTTLGKIKSDLGEHQQAEAAYARSLALCQANGHRAGAAQALTGLFGAAFRQGAFEQAAETARQSLQLNREAGDQLGEAIACHNLGVVHQSLEQHPRAIEYFNRALEIYQTIGAGQARLENTQEYLARSLAAAGK